MSGGGSVYTFLGKEDPGVGMLDFGRDTTTRCWAGSCPPTRFWRCVGVRVLLGQPDHAVTLDHTIT